MRQAVGVCAPKLLSNIPAQRFILALFNITVAAITESSLIQQGILKIWDDLQKARKLTVHQVVIIEASNRSNSATKLFGIFITGFAAMQGASFWFDPLKRVVNLRATGPNPVEKGSR